MTNQYLEKIAANLSAEALALVQESTKDPFLGDIALSKKLLDLRPISHEGNMVGFAIPRLEGKGYLRTGPIYITPEHRGKGLAGNFVKKLFANRKGRAYIEDMNKASIALYTGSGFKKTGRSLDSEGTKFHEYTND